MGEGGEARVELLTVWLDEVGLLDENGEVRGAVRSLERVESTAARLRERLGLDPRADAELAIVRGQASRSRSDLDALVEAARGCGLRSRVPGASGIGG